MRSIALILALVSAAFAARANDVDDGTARVTALEQRVRALGADRRALAAAYDAKTAEVARLKAQPSAWGRDRKLQALLAESQDMAGALDRKDGDVRAAGAALDRAKEALIGAVDAELGADPAPAPERAAALHELRRRLAADLVKPMHLADERIEPGDDAEDLELKAGALAQNETALAAELDRLKARAAYFRRQAKLTKSRARADEQDVFREEEARVPGRPNTASSRPANDSAAPPNPALPPGGPVQIGSNPANADARGRLDLAADPSIVLADVLASGTVDDLRRAERSGDPESLARSAERATRELAERAEKLHQHRLEMLERAKKLRGGP